MAIFVGKGTKVQLEIDSVFTDIGYVVTVTPPQHTMGEAESTHLSSTNREYLPTIGDYGDVAFTIEMDLHNATHIALLDAYNSKAIKNWKLLFPTGKVWGLVGFLKQFNPGEANVDSVVTADCTLRANSVDYNAS